MNEGEKFNSLVCEAERCARLFVRPRRKNDKDHTTAVFTHLMLRGQVHSAVRFITDRVSGGGILSPESPSNVSGMSVFDVLRQKHPESSEVVPSTVMPCETLPSLSDLDITVGHVEKVARQLQGAAGPGGSSVMQWHDYLLRFGRHSAHLRDSVATLARRLANSIVEWDDIRALVANHLIALDKCPGVRPIGIGEALRRILGKTVALVTRSDLEEVCGVDQLCSGLRSGLEGAIHAVHELFDENYNLGWGLLLVDATNAFNSVNRVAALWNVRVLWPRCSRFLFNTYCGYASLLLQDGNKCLLSKEGITQGDPLSMMLYAVAVLPLIHFLRAPGRWTQNWYADDSSCVADLPSLRAWFEELSRRGPDYGYHPEPSKTVLIVGPSDVQRAFALFSDLGIRVVSGGRFLGGFIGESNLAAEFVSSKVQLWSRCIRKLSDVADSQPQAAHAALARSLQFEWCHLQRVMPDIAGFFAPLRKVLNDLFYPTLLGGPVSEHEV